MVSLRKLRSTAGLPSGSAMCMANVRKDVK
jgi:hypothetical protein